MIKKENQEQQGIIINAQYIKDLSFENPEAPESLTSMSKAPEVKISIDVGVKKLQQDTYEVTLNVTSSANSDNKTIFLTELSYAGIFTVNMPDPEPILMVYCPNILFPFARRIIADITRDGGFPPLMLEPVDFNALYAKHKKSKN